jgi:hypothetical protein
LVNRKKNCVLNLQHLQKKVVYNVLYISNVQVIYLQKWAMRHTGFYYDVIHRGVENDYRILVLLDFVDILNWNKAYLSAIYVFQL